MTLKCLVSMRDFVLFSPTENTYNRNRFAISRSAAEARKETLIAVKNTAVAQSCLFQFM